MAETMQRTAVLRSATIRRSRPISSSFTPPGWELEVIHALGGTLARKPVVLAD